jgi:hypothetical protein
MLYVGVGRHCPCARQLVADRTVALADSEHSEYEWGICLPYGSRIISLSNRDNTVSTHFLSTDKY